MGPLSGEIFERLCPWAYNSCHLIAEPMGGRRNVLGDPNIYLVMMYTLQARLSSYSREDHFLDHFSLFFPRLI